jgi:cysteine desulfurase / selenocysteine lyase
MTAHTSPTDASNRTDALDVQAIRADFPILSTTLHEGVPLTYLDNAATTQRPRQVIQAIVDTYQRALRQRAPRHPLALGPVDRSLRRCPRKGPRLHQRAADRGSDLHHRGNRSDQPGCPKLGRRQSRKPGDEILVTEMEHHSNLVPWHQLAERTGAKVTPRARHRRGQTRSGEPRSSAVEEDEAGGRHGGFQRAGHDQSAPPVSRARTRRGCNRAGRCGPERSPPGDRRADSGSRFPGLQRAQDDGAVGRGRAVGTAGNSQRNASLPGRREHDPPGVGRRLRAGRLPARFEAGTPPIVPAIGLGAAIDYLNAVGLDAVARHEQDLTVYAHKVLTDLGTLRFLGPPPEEKSGIVSFTFKDNGPTPTTLPSCSTATAWPSGPATTVPCRFTNGSTWEPPPGRASTSTTLERKWIAWPRVSARCRTYFGAAELSPDSRHHVADRSRGGRCQRPYRGCQHPS